MSAIATQFTINKANSFKFNKEYFFDFLQLLKQEMDKGDLQYDSVTQYINKVINVLEFFDKYEMGMEQVTIEDIKFYAEETSRDTDSLFKNALKRLLRLINSRNNALITENEIDELEVRKKPPRKSSPLSIDEIIDIRNSLSRKNEYKLLFTFEMFYTYGVTLGEIVRFGRETYSEKDHTFTVSQNRVIKLSKVIVDLVEENPELLERKGRGAFSGYRKDIGSFINSEKNKREKFTWNDIQSTRETFFPTCPLCSEKYPNSGEFWVLVEYEYDEYKRKWLYCRDCALKIKGGPL